MDTNKYSITKIIFHLIMKHSLITKILKIFLSILLSIQFFSLFKFFLGSISFFIGLDRSMNDFISNLFPFTFSNLQAIFFIFPLYSVSRIIIIR